MHTTTLSTKGQLVVPKGLRHAGAFVPGTSFSVSLVAEGLLFKPTHQHSARKTRSAAEVCGIAKPYYTGPALSDAQIKARLQQEMALRLREHRAGR